MYNITKLDNLINVGTKLVSNKIGISKKKQKNRNTKDG